MRHAGHIITYDWSTSKNRTDAVHWAAFYSDCEHEVKKLTEGHRVTLTYNLYYAPGVGDLAKHAPAMNVTTLPLYGKVHIALCLSLSSCATAVYWASTAGTPTHTAHSQAAKLSQPC